MNETTAKGIRQILESRRHTHANSLTVMKKANAPGKRMTAEVLSVAAIDPQNSSLAKMALGPSKIRLHVARVTAMIGASQKRVAKGLLRPIVSLSSSICVNAHLNPPKADAVRTSIMPTRWNFVSPETISTRPTVMIEMMPTSRQVGFSRWKRKAKRSTNPREDDLHMADSMWVS